MSFEDDVEVEADAAPSDGSKRRRENEQEESPLQSALLLETLKQQEEQQKKILETIKKTLGQVQQMRNGPRTDNQQMPRSQRTGGSTGTRPIFNLPLSRLSLAEKMALICKDYNAQ